MTLHYSDLNYCSRASNEDYVLSFHLQEILSTLQSKCWNSATKAWENSALSAKSQRGTQILTTGRYTLFIHEVDAKWKIMEGGGCMK